MKILAIVVLNCNGIGIIKDVNIINLDNFDEDNLDTIIIIRFLAWHIKFVKSKELKKRYMKN